MWTEQEYNEALRLNEMIEIARNNAIVGMDQNNIDDYWENCCQTIGDKFPDVDQIEMHIVEYEFDKKIKGA